MYFIQKSDNQTAGGKLVKPVITQPISPSTDATVSLQTITSVSEGGMLNVTVELAASGTLACDLVVTLLATPDTATGKFTAVR